MAYPQPFSPSSLLDDSAVHPWSPASREARLVAGSLRSASVTLVHGGTAADREAFLTLGVMPLLARRREDQAGSARPPRVLPFPDRRRALGRGSAPAELVLRVDDWSSQPLQPLADHIERAQSLSDADDDDETPGKVLLVMQNFEDALAGAARAIHPDRFWLELAQATRIQPHGLQLLLITQESDTAALRWLRQHLPELGEHALLLQAPQSGVDLHWTPVPGLTGDATTAEDPADPLTVISDQEWLQAVQGAVDRAAQRSGAPRVQAQAAAPTGSPSVAAAEAVVKAVGSSTELAATPAPITRRAVDVAPAPAPAQAQADQHAHAPAPAQAPAPEPAARTAPALGASAANLLAARPIDSKAATAAPAIGRIADLTAPPVTAGPRLAAAPSVRRGPAPRWLLRGAGVAVCAALATVWWGRGPAEPTPAVVAIATPKVTRPVATVTTPDPAAAEPALPSPTVTTPPPVAVTVPLAPTATSSAPVATSTAVPQPPPPIDTEPGSALRGLLAGLPWVDLRGEPAQAAARLAAAQRPTLALVRYDTLRKLPASAGLETVRVVAPLFVEPIQVWVRADSSMRRLDDLAQGRVDVGRNGGDAASAAGITEALFGRPVPAARQRRLPDAEALAALQRGDVDAVVRVQASPLTALATAAVAQGSLRALILDRARPASARALRDYLSAPLSGPATAGDRTLGVMSFLMVQGGDDAARQRLAGEALQALCTGLPALRTDAKAVWSVVQPDLQLPAGKPYALSAEQTAERSSGCGRGATAPVNDTTNSVSPKGNLS